MKMRTVVGLLLLFLFILVQRNYKEKKERDEGKKTREENINGIFGD